MAGALVARDLPEELGFAAALVLAASWIGRNLFLRRQVAALRKVAERLAAGDLTARTGASRWLGGLGDLGRALDAMAASLEARIAELRRLAAERGRDPIPVTIYAAPPTPAAIERFAAAGAERVVFNLPTVDAGEELSGVRELAALIRPYP